MTIVLDWRLDGSVMNSGQNRRKSIFETKVGEAPGYKMSLFSLFKIMTSREFVLLLHQVGMYAGGVLMEFRS